MKKGFLYFAFIFLVKINCFQSKLIETTNSLDVKVLCIDWKTLNSVKTKEIICTGNSDKSVFFRNFKESVFFTVNSMKSIYAIDLDYSLKSLAIGVQFPPDKKAKLEGKYAIKVADFSLLEKNKVFEINLLGHDDLITALHWPKESIYMLFSGSLDGNVKVWDILSCKCISTLNFSKDLNKKTPVWCVQAANNLLNDEINNEEIYLAAGFTNGCIKVWKLVVKHEDVIKVEVLDEVTLKSNNGFVRALDWSEDDKFIVAGYHNGDIRIWEPQKKDRKCIFHTKGHCGAVCGVKFLSDNEHLISAGIDGKVKLWHLKKGESEILEALEYENTNIPIQVNCMELSPDNLAVLAGINGGIVMVDLQDILLREDFKGESSNSKKSEKETISIKTNK